MSHSSHFFRALLVAMLVCLPARIAWADDEPRSGAWLAVDLQLSPLHDGLGVLIGLAGGWESSSGLRIGGALYDLLNGPPVVGVENAETKLHFLGVSIGQRVPLGSVGLTAEVLLGAGDVSGYRGQKKDDFGRSWFLVAQPSLGLELPALGPVRWRLGAGYRFTTALTHGEVAVDPVAGPLVHLTTNISL